MFGRVGCVALVSGIIELIQLSTVRAQDSIATTKL